MDSLTFRQAIDRSEYETAIEEEDVETVGFAFAQDAVIYIVKQYSTAGERVTEELESDGTPVKLKRTPARIIDIEGLSANTGYELLPDGSIILPKGTWTIVYTAFPEMGNLTPDNKIPLPPMFAEAVHWYVSCKYCARFEGQAGTQTQYYAEAYNNAAREAEHFYAAQTRKRRMPCRRC